MVEVRGYVKRAGAAAFPANGRNYEILLNFLANGQPKGEFFCYFVL